MKIMKQMLTNDQCKLEFSRDEFVSFNEKSN